MPVAKISKLLSEDSHSELVDFVDNELPNWHANLDKYAPERPDSAMNRLTYNSGAQLHPYVRKCHEALVDLVADFYGEAVEPTYALVSKYYEGGVCPMHVDRAACRYTLGYMVRCDPPSWPIYVSAEEAHTDELGSWGWSEATGFMPQAVNDKEIDYELFRRSELTWLEIDQEPNDGYMLSGTLNWHYREKLPYGTADVLLFHFVPKGTQHDLWVRNVLEQGDNLADNWAEGLPAVQSTEV